MPDTREPITTSTDDDLVVTWAPDMATRRDNDGINGRPLPAEALVPNGLRAPASIPTDVFSKALETFLACRRLDMAALAHEIGWSRATLYRKVPPREVLLGEVVWFLTRHALVGAIEASKRLKGAKRVATSAERFLRFVSEQPAFRSFLEHEPEVALRVLTSKHGPVQAGMTSATEALLNEEARRGNLRLLEDAHTLAYAIVRLGEGFLYADLVADEANDPERASRVIALLLEPLST